MLKKHIHEQDNYRNCCFDFMGSLCAQIANDPIEKAPYITICKKY